MSKSIEILSTELPEGEVGKPYRVQLENRTFPPTSNLKWWSENNIPEGLTLDEKKGILSGVCNSATYQTVSFWVMRLDTEESNYKRFTLSIKAGSSKQPLKIEVEAKLTSIEGSDFKLDLVASGGTPPYRWVVENLPIGLHLSGSKIFGIPNMRGGYFPLNIEIFDQDGERDTHFCWLLIN